MRIELKAASHAAQANSLRLALVCVGFALMVGIFFTLQDTFVRAVVVGQLALVVAPVWYRWIHRELDYFEPIHLIGMINFVFFGLGSIWVVDDPARIAYDLYLADYVPRAATYCLLGQAALLLGYFGPWHRFHAPKRVAEWPVGVLFLLGMVGTGFVGYVAHEQVERSFHTASKLLVALSPIAQLAPLFLYAWSLGWLLYFSGRATRPQKLVVFAVLLPLSMAVAFLTVSDKSLVMTLAGIPIIARWYGRRRIPWSVLIVLLLILVFVVFPLYNTYRGTDPHLGTEVRLEQTYQMLENRGGAAYVDYAIWQFKYRMALINSVAVVVRDVGRWVPFAMGDTIFMPFAASFVPRYLWPEKPVLQGGRHFGRLFRITDFLSRDTFIAATFPGELYWNFHLPGVILGMGLFGFVVRRLYRAYGEGHELDPARRAVHVMVLVRVAHWGGTIAIDTGLLVRLLLMLAVLRWIGRRFGLLAPPSEAAV